MFHTQSLIPILKVASAINLFKILIFRIYFKMLYYNVTHTHLWFMCHPSMCTNKWHPTASTLYPLRDETLKQTTSTCILLSNMTEFPTYTSTAHAVAMQQFQNLWAIKISRVAGRHKLTVQMKPVSDEYTQVYMAFILS